MTGTQLKQYIDAIPPLIPTSVSDIPGAGSLATMDSIDLGSSKVTGTLPSARLPDAGLTAGTYPFASITINAKGMITAISANTITSPTASVFGRTGTVTAQAGDYSIGQISGAGALAALGSIDIGGSYATGTLAASRLGSFTGDVTNSGYTMTLASSGVVSGSYSFATFTVDAKGRVTAASSGNPYATNTDIEIADATMGLILKSPNGTRWRITIDDSGTLSRTSL